MIQIPTETFEQISEDLDKRDLMNLCYVSPFFRDQANRILYRNVFTGRNGVPGQEYVVISQFIRTIRLSPHLASHVKELKFVAPSKVHQLLLSKQPNAIQNITSLVTSRIGRIGKPESPFSGMVNIRKLTVETFDSRVPWPEYLNGFPPGCIQELETWFPINRHFLEFLELHPSIRTLHFPFLNTDNTPDVLAIPHAIVPSIGQLTAGSRILPLIKSWKNLTHLQLGCSPWDTPELCISALEIIGPQLVNLMISGHNGDQWNNINVLGMARIAENTPELKVFSLRLYSLPQNQLKTNPFNLTSSHWQKLETLIFIHISAASIGVGDGFTLFPSLQKEICVNSFGPGKTVKCYQRLSVTGEIEECEPPSDQQLDYLCFNIFSSSRAP